MSNCVQFMYELGRDAELTRKFCENPETEMERWNLTDDEKAILRNRDLEGLMATEGLRNHHLTNSNISAYQ